MEQWYIVREATTQELVLIIRRSEFLNNPETQTEILEYQSNPNYKVTLETMTPEAAKELGKLAV